MDADGKNVRKITNYLDFDYAPTWSPDGRQIAFVSVRGEQQDIYVIDIDGHNRHNLTNHPSPDNNPTWSPDGEADCL